MVRRSHHCADSHVHLGGGGIRARELLVALACAAGVLLGPAAASAAARPMPGLLPEVVGAPVVGEKLVCGAGSWNGNVQEFKYVWLRDAVPIAFGVTYTVTFADAGHSLWCVVTAVGSEGSGEAESSNSLEIEGAARTAPPENTVAPEVSGKASVGETLSCSTGTWTASPQPAFTYQWVRDVAEGEQTIEAATASTYRIANQDAGHSLACKVTATNSAGSASKLSSNSVRVPGTRPENEMPPRGLGAARPKISATRSSGCATRGCRAKNQSRPRPTAPTGWRRPTRATRCPVR